MGLFRKSEKRAEELNEDNGAALLSALIRGDSMSKAMALEIPAVSACVGLIADRIASLPLRLYDSSGGKVTEVDDDVRVGYINGDTGDTLSGSEMLKAWVADYFLTKGAYTYIYKNSYGKVLGLYYVRSEDVSINSNCKPIFKGYAICCDGATYLPHEFIKILRNSKGDGRGHSIIEENPLILSVAYNTISFENQLVKKGGNKKGFLKAKNRLTDAAMDKIKEAWKNLYSNNGENVIVLNDGMDFAESSNTSVEMQLNERKISTDTAICSLFGVPYDMLTGNASEAVKVRFFENAVMPVINAIEAALDRDLLLEGEKSHRYFAFDTREATRGDIQTRYNAYAVALQNNFMQLDEVRKLEDLEPLGVNYVKLGLNDVLLDPKTGRIYTPNTNAMVDMGTGSGAVLTNAENGDTIEERADEELRYNPYHDPSNGRFTGGGGGGSGDGVLVVEQGQKGKGYYVIPGEKFDKSNAPNNRKIEIDPNAKMSDTLSMLASGKARYKEVKDLPSKLTSEEIIDRVSGGDMTKGSCSSLALAYIGNEAGYDVLDFRGGSSQSTFSDTFCISTISREVGGIGFKDMDAIKGTFKALDENVVEGKLYYLVTGRHAAVVRKNGEKFEYLELQSRTQSKNGFHELTPTSLHMRFSARRSCTYYGTKYEQKGWLIDGDALMRNSDFKQMLGYINTDPSKQKKGASGNVK